MAKVVFKPVGGSGINLRDFDIRRLTDYDASALKTQTAKFFDSNKEFTLFTGTGFKYKTVGGEVRDVTGGTVTKIEVMINGVKALLTTGVKLAASKVFDLYVDGDADGALKYMLSGNDTVIGTRFSDVLFAAKGKDTVKGGAGNDTLMGEAGNDILKGDAGRDKLIGGIGKDKLFGGSGADTFVFASPKDSTVGPKGRDTIEDFSRSQKDKIDLKAIDADSGSGGNQAFDFIGTSKFSKEAGELRYEKKGGDSFVYGDVNGDGRADFAIHVDAGISFVKGDFLL